MADKHFSSSDKRQAELEYLRGRVAELEKAQEQDQHFFHDNQYGIVHIDTTNRFIDVNQAFCQMVGWTRTELTEMKNSNVITPEKWHEWESTEIYVNRLLIHDYSGVYRKEFIRKDGSILPVEMQSFIACKQDGSIDYIWSLVKDVSDSEHVTVLYAESEKWLHMVAKNVPGCLFQIRLTRCGDISVRYLSDENESNCQSHARSPRINNAEHLNSVHPEDQIRFEEALRNSARKMSSFEIEHRVLLPGNKTEWLSTRAQPERKLNGDTIWTGVSINITERVTAEVKVRDNQSNLSALIENTDTSIWSVDSSYCLILGNSQFHRNMTRTLGKPFQKGDSVFPLILPDSVRREWKEYYDRALDGERFTIETWRHYGENPAFMEYRLNPIVNVRGKVDGVVVFSRDLTREKAAEEKLRASEDQARKLQEQFIQAQKMESIGRLAGGVAHDLNNLLSPILGYSEMLLDECDDLSPLRDSIYEIIGASERARDLIRQLLVFSRRQPFKFRPVDIREMLHRFHKLIRSTIREDIDIVFDLADALPGVIGDPGQLEQVIMNLVVNAQDALTDGGQITIACHQVVINEHDEVDLSVGQYLLLRFSDTGSGIDPDNLGRIFEPFFTTKEVDQGTGLGLATVFGIIKEHNGHIQAFSTPGTGTTFEIYLPTTNLPFELQDSLNDNPVDLTDRPGTILLVEDNKPVRGLTKKALARVGYRVFEVENGSEALSFLKSFEGSLDLIVTDVIMPQMNGQELNHHVKRLYPDIKVLFMSGYSDSVIKGSDGVVSAEHFIQKPFSVKTLTDKVRTIIASDF